VEHITPLAECTERYKRVEDKIDNINFSIRGLVEKSDKINGRYEHHLEEAIPYRSKVDEQERKLLLNESFNRQMVGIQISVVLSILIQIGAFVYLWGGLTKQVEINTGRLSSIEDIHPRYTKQ
jgi:hypothetical protein